MPTIQSLKNALKSKARKSQEPADESSDKYPDWVTTNEPEPPGKLPIFLDEAALEYVMNLKPLYSDISFDDLTSTLNRLHNENFRAEDIEACYIYECKAMISQNKRRNAGIHQPSLPNMMELDGPLLWLKDTAFNGEENYLHYNRPIITLAGHRRKYEAALAALKRSSS